MQITEQNQIIDHLKLQPLQSAAPSSPKVESFKSRSIVDDTDFVRDSQDNIESMKITMSGEYETMMAEKTKEFEKQIQETKDNYM